MAGHSHWAGIKYKKAATDAKRGKLFSKMAKEIMVAARLGGSDPDANVRLRHAIEKARAVSMPKDNIDRAVKKGAGEVEGQELTEVTYEGYGPGGVGILVECLTDNTNRTHPQLRKTFDQRGGSLGKSGTVQWKFRTRGLISVKKESADEDTLVELALETGADDVTDEGDVFEIITEPEAFDPVCQALDAKGIPTEVREITKLPETQVTPDLETAQKVIRLMAALEDHDDVQNVYADFAPPAEALQGLEDA